MTLKVTQIFIYPVKSCRGLELDKADLGTYGLLYDRLWVVTTEHYKFLTARTHPKLVKVIQSLQLDSSQDNKVLIKLENEGVDQPLYLDPNQENLGPEIQFNIWDDQVHGYDCGDTAALWFSKVLGEKVRLLIKGKCPRKVNEIYLKRDGLGHVKPETAFADEFPIQIASEESLEALREELPPDVKEKVGMQNFRPNLVLSGCSKPYEEDEYGLIRIGNNEFHCDKPCARCILPNLDPETGILHKTEPSKTLMRTRRCFPHLYKNKSFFGINIIPLKKEGTIEVGQAVEVLSKTAK